MDEFSGRSGEDIELSAEIIGDSLTAGQYSTYERLSSYAYGLGEGLGNVEYSITASPGICLHDTDCRGNPRGQVSLPASRSFSPFLITPIDLPIVPPLRHFLPCQPNLRH